MVVIAPVNLKVKAVTLKWHVFAVGPRGEFDPPAGIR